MSSNAYGSCKLCQFSTSLAGDIPTMVNHYLQHRDFELLHAGQQSDRTGDGELWHTTVAVLGTPAVVQESAPARVVIQETE